MKIKHLFVLFAIIGGIVLFGCGGGDLGVTDANANQVYTTAGFTVDAAKAATSATSNAK